MDAGELFFGETKASFQSHHLQILDPQLVKGFKLVPPRSRTFPFLSCLICTQSERSDVSSPAHYAHPPLITVASEHSPVISHSCHQCQRQYFHHGDHSRYLLASQHARWCLFHHWSCRSPVTYAGSDARKVVPSLLIRVAGTLSLTPSHITMPGPPSLACLLPHTPPTWVPRPAQAVYRLCTLRALGPCSNLGRCLSSFQSPERSVANSGCNAHSHKRPPVW